MTIAREQVAEPAAVEAARFSPEWLGARLSRVALHVAVRTRGGDLESLRERNEGFALQ